MATLALLLERFQLEGALTSGTPDVEFASVQCVRFSQGQIATRTGDLRLFDDLSGTEGHSGRWHLSGAPSAIGYALDKHRHSVPQQLIQAARRRGIATFTIPRHIRPALMHEAALQLLVDSGTLSLEATVDIVGFLTACLDNPRPEHALLERLHSLTGASYVLLSPWGTEQARSGPSGWQPEPRIEATRPHDPVAPGGHGVRTVRIEHAGRVRHFLVTIAAPPAAGPLIELAATLLRVMSLQRSLEQRQQEAERSLVLNDWVSGRIDVHELGDRLGQVGFELEGTLLVAVARVDIRVRYRHQRRHRQELLEVFRQAGDELFATLGLTALSAVRGDHALWIFPGVDPETHLVSLAGALGAASDKPFRVGISQPQRHPVDAVAPYRQALLAAQTAREPRTGRCFSSLDPIAWVLEQQPDANLRTLHQQLVMPIKQADATGKLWHTLTRYLHSPDDLSGLASELHIHVNTLRYRLKRIEALIGQPLARPETLARLHLAERIDAMLHD